MGNMRIILRLQAGTGRRTPNGSVALKKRQLPGPHKAEAWYKRGRIRELGQLTLRLTRLIGYEGSGTAGKSDASRTTDGGGVYAQKRRGIQERRIEDEMDRTSQVDGTGDGARLPAHQLAGRERTEQCRPSKALHELLPAGLCNQRPGSPDGGNCNLDRTFGSAGSGKPMT